MNDLGRIRLVVFDVDGVLTDGAILLGARGAEWKSFNVRDGLAIAAAIKAGVHVAFVSGRKAEAVAWRAKELGVRHCLQGVKDKRAELARLTRALKLTRAEVAFVGDDVNDLPAFAAAGLRVAVADAAPELKRAADLVTRARGGHGAAREVTERILRAKGKWLSVVSN